MKLLVSLASLAAYVTVVHANNGLLPRGYIFELDSDKDTSKFVDAAKKYGQVHLEMSHSLFNGVSVQLSDDSDSESAVAKLLALPGVKGSWPIATYAATPRTEDRQINKKREIPSDELETPDSLDDDGDDDDDDDAEAGDDAAKTTDKKKKKKKTPYNPHVMTQVDKVHAKGITGKGTKIAIIDTGIDYKHEALGRCLGKGCLVIGGYDFVGDNFNSSGQPVPDNDPMDQNGMGTHMAGVVAAQPRNRVSGFTGSAPGARLIAYKITGADGTSRSDILISALNRAYDDGADIILVTYHTTGGWNNEAASLAASRIAAKGIPVIAPVGDNDASGMFGPGSPASGDGVTAVASVDNTLYSRFFYGSSFSVNGGKRQTFKYQDYFTPDGPTNFKLPLKALTLDSTVQGDACQRPPDSSPDLTNFVVLVRVGGCDPYTKASNLYSKGGHKIIYYNDRPGVYAETLSGSPVDFGGIVESTVGENWVKLLKEGKNITMDLTQPNRAKVYIGTSNNTESGGVVSGSSWGPTMGMTIKPHFAAPGGWIVSTTLNNKYDIMSNHFYNLPFSSQSAAYVAGVYALIRQARGIKTLQGLESILSSTANARKFWGPFYTQDFLAPVPNQGTGLIQVLDAINSKLAIDPTGLAFNDTDHIVPEAKLTLKNVGKSSATYKLTTRPLNTTYQFSDKDYGTRFPPDFTEKTATLEFSTSQLVLKPGESATINVRVTKTADIPNPEKLPVWSGYIAINGTDGTSMTVPYQGLAGSLNKADPFLSRQGIYFSRRKYELKENDTVSFPQPRGVWYNILWRQKLLSPLVNFEILDADTGKVVDRMPGGYPKRLAPLYPEGFLQWQDGKTANGTVVPFGRYRLRASALRVYGDENNPNDFFYTYSVAFKVGSQATSGYKL